MQEISRLLECFNYFDILVALVDNIINQNQMIIYRLADLDVALKLHFIIIQRQKQINLYALCLKRVWTIVHINYSKLYKLLVSRQECTGVYLYECEYLKFPLKELNYQAIMMSPSLTPVSILTN